MAGGRTEVVDAAKGNIIHVSVEYRRYGGPKWARFDCADVRKLEGVSTLRSLDL